MLDVGQRSQLRQFPIQVEVLCLGWVVVFLPLLYLMVWVGFLVRVGGLSAVVEG
ncbi:MAG: hypothetical protein ICV80_23785 [Microcoleus sp. T1-bin1]|nr:hypothetical protein [Microcoleus sp. T1-bin1]